MQREAEAKEKKKVGRVEAARQAAAAAASATAAVAALAQESEREAREEIKIEEEREQRRKIRHQHSAAHSEGRLRAVGQQTPPQTPIKGKDEVLGDIDTEQRKLEEEQKQVVEQAAADVRMESQSDTVGSQGDREA